MARFSADEARPELLRPWFFDCLHVDGDRSDRSSRWPSGWRSSDGSPSEFRIPGIVTADPSEAEAVLVEALAAGHEGVMVKGAASRYEAGRRGKAWQKVKPVHTLDLVVLAVEWGHGRRRGWLSNLHLGARDPDGGDPVMVGKTFKGLTDELLRWQTEQFLARETGAERPGRLHRPRPAGARGRDRHRRRAALDPLSRAASPCASPGSCATGPDKDPPDADSIDAVRAFLGGAPPTPSRFRRTELAARSVRSTGSSSSAHELMQNRWPVGPGPSLKTWPR